MIDVHSPQFNAALHQASSEQGLADYYEQCVRPLFKIPLSQWPMCCGGACLPCAQWLVTVGLRTCELLNINPDDLPDGPQSQADA